MRTARFVAAVLVALVLAAGCRPVPPPSFSGTVYELDSTTRALMTGRSWRPGCPVGLDDLRLVVVTHWGFDGRRHQGEVVVHRDWAHAVVEVFARLHDERFPIERMRLVDHYGADDDASMAANNTSAFNCRPITGDPSRWSLHSYGVAIDINPVQNPYVRGTTVLPPAGAPHATVRSPSVPGLITAGGPVPAAFASIGWTWGGDWSSLKDYQHVEAPSGAAAPAGVTTRVRSAPTGTLNADGRLEVAFVDRLRGIARQWQTCAGCGWQGPVPHGTPPVEGTPALAANPDGRLELFAVGADGTVGHAWQTCAGCGWSGWFPLWSGAARSGGVAAATAPDGVVVAALSAGGIPLVARQSGGWVPDSLGAGWPELVGAPALAVNADGRVEVFATSADGWVWHAWEQAPGGPWSAWAPLWSGAAGSPAAAVNADGRMEVAFSGTDRVVRHAWQLSPGGGWSGLAEFAGEWRGDPALVVNHDGRLEMIVAADDRTLWHTWQWSAGGLWSPTVPFGGATP